MKKVLYAFITLFLLAMIAAWVLIPAKLTISSAVAIPATDIGTERFLVNENAWHRWWPGHPAASDSLFAMNQDRYRLTEKFYKSASILIHHGADTLPSKIFIIPFQIDTAVVEWKCTMPSGINPFTRFSAYLTARTIKRNMDSVLAGLKSFLSSPENVYGINIEKVSTKDTLYLSFKKLLDKQPSTPQIYQLIRQIQAYATAKGARQTGYPIYNVTRITDQRLQLMAAVPIDKALPDKDGYAMKHMVRGSFMSTEVTGGEYTVAAASRSLSQFFSDYRKTSMAMNYTMLITDRLLQPDSTRWITRLYEPVF
ncbi:MAG TPA: hypothetical protein VG842_12540 [Sediminibacterium sp.]|nr:hypothetical protein [Sediminibacterium sp.]